MLLSIKKLLQSCGSLEDVHHPESITVVITEKKIKRKDRFGSSRSITSDEIVKTLSHDVVLIGDCKSQCNGKGTSLLDQSERSCFCMNNRNPETDGVKQLLLSPASHKTFRTDFPSLSNRRNQQSRSVERRKAHHVANQAGKKY